ncbi:Uncharacterised protein [uncultured archaeon]|nr:Uncharacterised protein [uncultured archaeon]
MNCPNCNSAVEENWKYCASCGANIAVNTENDTIMNYSTHNRTMAGNNSIESRTFRAERVCRDDTCPALGKSRTSDDEELVERMAKEIGVSILASLGGIQTRGLAIRVIKPQSKQSDKSMQETCFKEQENTVNSKTFDSYLNGCLNSQSIQSHNITNIKGCAIEYTHKQESASKPVFEPKIDITRLPGKIAVDAELPSVVSGNDISTTLLGESMEIRAIAPEKMYFKVVPVPRRMRIIGSSFLEGKLRVELGEAVRR